MTEKEAAKRVTRADARRQSRRRSRGAREDRRDAGALPRHGRVPPRAHLAQRAGAPPTLWYGMPAYAKNGKVICFFRADKYMTFGLSDKANHDIEDGAQHQLRESAWFLTAMDDATEAKLSAIVRKAAS